MTGYAWLMTGSLCGEWDGGRAVLLLRRIRTTGMTRDAF